MMSKRHRRCCVPSCNVTVADNITLHSFPNPCDVTKPEELERFRTWVLKIGGDIVGEDDKYIHRNRYVCHRHFEDIVVYPSKKLNRMAIPTLHIPGRQCQLADETASHFILETQLANALNTSRSLRKPKNTPFNNTEYAI